MSKRPSAKLIKDPISFPQSSMVNALNMSYIDDIIISNGVVGNMRTVIVTRSKTHSDARIVGVFV